VYIVYDIDPGSVIRVDGLIFDVSEFASTWSEGFAFRGDDREPSAIFEKGFSKRDTNFGVATTGVLNTQHAHTITTQNVFRNERPSVANRDTIYRLGPTEVLLRTQHLDLEKATCVSTTRDPALATGFPLGGTPHTYLYVITPNQKRLDTYLIQEKGGRDGLAKSMEVTFNLIPAADVFGAARVKRTVTGIDAMSSVTFEIDAWFVNDGGKPKQGDLKDLLALAKKANPQFSLKGTKLVGGGAKDEDAKSGSDELLYAAIKAAQKVAAILNSGSLEGLVRPGARSSPTLTGRPHRSGSFGSSKEKTGGPPKWL
jgi:hypothetical protein